MERKSKTRVQQEKYYEVEDIYTYMLSTYLNGNFDHLRRLYRELNKECRKGFIMFIYSNTTYSILGEILWMLL